MLDDALKSGHRLIGMIQPMEPEGSLQRIGCAGRVTSFTETEDGRYLVALTGISRFRVGEEIEGFAPYRRGAADRRGVDAGMERVGEPAGLDRDGLARI